MRLWYGSGQRFWVYDATTFCGSRFKFMKRTGQREKVSLNGKVGMRIRGLSQSR